MNDLSNLDTQANFPAVVADRYQIDRVLGTNPSGGRVTYLARAIATNLPVVLKEFHFAKVGNNWRGYDRIAREFEILQALDHPGIPRYIEQFDTDRAVYLVQDYKDAPTLAQRIATPDSTTDLIAVRRAAISLLDILVYLQTRTPPVLHRDLKPENILLSDAGEVFLVDFGFARRGVSAEGAASSMVRGTLGFMAPEQMLNRPVTTATDLYGLGVTLICWLAGTPSDRVGDWIGEGLRLEVDRAVPQLPEGARRWLATLVEPQAGDRFDSARSALAALQTIAFDRDTDGWNATPDLTPGVTPDGTPDLTPGAPATIDLGDWRHQLDTLPLRRLVLLMIASGAIAWGIDGWWALSMAAGRAIETAIRSLLGL